MVELKPSKCIEKNPTPISVWFCGEPINLSVIAINCGMYPSAVSRIFSGARYPTLKAARKIAEVLNMRLDEFLDALDEHIREKRNSR